jgi:hypothetical protein
MACDLPGEPLLEEPRELFRRFHIDTNRINSRSRLENMNKLERWKEQGLIGLDMSDVVSGEARAGGDQRRTRKTLSYIHSGTMAETLEEQRQLTAIKAVLFPFGTRTQNESNDAEIAFNAGKYKAILVTADGDLLTHRDELLQLGIQVMTDHEAVALVEKRITERDKRARRSAQMRGVPCPDWVGKD